MGFFLACINWSFNLCWSLWSKNYPTNNQTRLFNSTLFSNLIFTMFQIRRALPCKIDANFNRLCDKKHFWSSHRFDHWLRKLRPDAVVLTHFHLQGLKSLAKNLGIQGMNWSISLQELATLAIAHGEGCCKKKLGRLSTWALRLWAECTIYTRKQWRDNENKDYDVWGLIPLAICDSYRDCRQDSTQIAVCRTSAQAGWAVFSGIGFRQSY